MQRWLKTRLGYVENLQQVSHAIVARDKKKKKTCFHLWSCIVVEWRGIVQVMGKSKNSISMDFEMIPWAGKINVLYKFFIDLKMFC
jgi:hypothetical protein